MRHFLLLIIAITMTATGHLAQVDAEELTANASFRAGSVNQVLIESGPAQLAVYTAAPGSKANDAPIEKLLLTHGRRDVVTDALPLIRAGVGVTAPEREAYALQKAADYWNAFPQSQFHDYGQQSTKILAKPVEVETWVKEGDAVPWRGLSFEVIDTPGFTRGAVTYLVQLDGKRLAFTGDLIYGDGQILDLYSFQDAITEAQVRGYHGYGARLADLVSSLRKVSDAKPDLIVPARGPVIRNPQEAIEKLTKRVQALYKNYLSTNALHWYFKEDRMRLCGERVLGKGADIELMPYSQHEKTPEWVFENSTSRLLVSDNGHGFLLDCGSQRVIDAIQELIDGGIVKQVDGIFVTHYHDDHTDKVQAAAEKFKCPVYATEEYADLLERPSAYHLPAMTANPIRNVKVLADGHKMTWNEFELTFHFFPGQTYYHGAVFARKKGERPIFFVGDAFAPSGIDDYCVLNRNLVREDSGYLLCLKKLRDIDEPFWIVNEHIAYVFAFTDKELDYIENRYRDRIAILRDLFPWDDPNYGIDEQWAVLYPRTLGVTREQAVTFEVRVTNYSDKARTFRVTPRLPKGVTSFAPSPPLNLAAGKSDSIVVAVQITRKAEIGNQLLTADIESEGMSFRSWVDAVLIIKE